MGQILDPLFVSIVNGRTISALQTYRRNAGNTAYEVATPAWLASSNTFTAGPQIFTPPAGTVGVRVNSSSGNSANLMEFTDTDGTTVRTLVGNQGVKTRGIVVGNSSENPSYDIATFGGTVSFSVAGAPGTHGVRMSATTPLGWNSTTDNPNGSAIDTAFVRVSAGVTKLSDGSTGGGQLEFPQVADVGTPSSNSARIGAEDVAGTAELIVADEAGTETQISPHAADAPANFYDGDGTNRIMDSVLRSINPIVGRVEFLNLTRLARMVERILAGDLATLQALPAPRRRLHIQETIAEYNARTGRAKRTRTWQEIQDAHQAKYDAERATELAAHDVWTASVAEHAEWEALPGEVREITPEPIVGAEPNVRPQRDIRKAKPKWLADRGG